MLDLLPVYDRFKVSASFAVFVVRIGSTQNLKNKSDERIKKESLFCLYSYTLYGPTLGSKTTHIWSKFYLIKTER